MLVTFLLGIQAGAGLVRVRVRVRPHDPALCPKGSPSYVVALSLAKPTPTSKP